MPSLSSIALFLFIGLLSLNLIGHGLVSDFVVGVIGLIWCVLWVLAALNVYDGNVSRPRSVEG